MPSQFKPDELAPVVPKRGARKYCVIEDMRQGQVADAEFTALISAAITRELGEIDCREGTVAAHHRIRLSLIHGAPARTLLFSIVGAPKSYPL